MSYYQLQSVYADKTFSDISISLESTNKIDNYDLYYSCSLLTPNMYYNDKEIDANDETSFKFKVRESNSGNCKRQI